MNQQPEQQKLAKHNPQTLQHQPQQSTKSQQYYEPHNVETKNQKNYKHSKHHSEASSIELPPNVLTAQQPSWRYSYTLHVYRHILLCLLWGSMSLIIGVSLVTLSFVVRSKTTSVLLLESLPVFVPGFVFCFNGLFMLIFMISKTRRFSLLKSIFALYLLSIILLCVVIFSQWSVHLPRIIKHRFCVYHDHSRQCSCTQSNTYLTTANELNASLLESTVTVTSFEQQTIIKSSEIVFESIDNCQNIHGILKNCLQIILTISIIAIPVSLSSIWTLFRLHRYQYSKLFFERHQQTRLPNLYPISKDKKNFERENHQKAAVINTLISNTANSNNLDNLNHDCISPNFSSRDHLIVTDNASSSHGQFRLRDFELMPDERPRIWSSQFSAFSQNCDARSDNDKSTFQHRLRRVVSVMFDHKSRQNLSKWNLFRRKDSSTATNSSTTKRHHQSQILLPPPHASRLFALNNNTSNNPLEYSIQNCTPLGRFSGENLHRSSVYITTSPSSSSLSFLSSKASKLPNSDPFPLDCQMQETNFNEPANPSLIDELQPEPIESIKWTLTELTPEPELLSTEFHEDYQQEYPIHYRSTKYQDNHQPQTQPQALRSEAAFERLLIADQNIPNSGDVEYFGNTATPLGTPIIESDHLNEHFTTFEEAFKNYYDSQHRISEYQFHTLPVNKSRSKVRSKRPRIKDDKKLVLPVMSDDEFPPIEPPVDYQNNVFNAGTSLGSQQFVDDNVPEVFHSQAEQQQDWFYQIIAEMDRIQKNQIDNINLNIQEYSSDMNKLLKSNPNGGDVDDDDVGDDDDEDFDDEDNDEAGDTSTSQDIAEFELDLDDESLKVSEHQEQSAMHGRKESNSIISVIQAYPNKYLSKTQVPHKVPFQESQPIFQVINNPFQPIKNPLRPLILHPDELNDNQTTEDDDNDDDEDDDDDDDDDDGQEIDEDAVDDDLDNVCDNDEEQLEDDEVDDINCEQINNLQINHNSFTERETDSDPESIQDSSSLTAGYIAPPTPFTSFL